MARRQEAFKIGNKTKYKKLRNQSVRMSKPLKCTFYQRTVALMCGDRGRTWWKTVKTICGLNSKDKTLECCANSEYNGDTKQLAQAINNMFVSISKDLQPLLPMIYHNCEELLNDLIISVEDVKKQLMHTHQCATYLIAHERLTYLQYGKVQISAHYQTPNQSKISVKILDPSLSFLY